MRGHDHGSDGSDGSDGSEDDDDVDVFSLGRGGRGDAADGADGDDPAADEADALEDHRTKVVALTGLAIVVVIVAVAIGLTSLVDTSSGALPSNPQAAAQRWGDAVVAGDTGRRQRLECAAGSATADALRLVLVAAQGVRAGTAVPRTSTRWSVPLSVDGAGSGSAEDSVSVTVVLRSGRYLVC